LKKNKEKAKKKTLHASHRKCHLAAVADPIVREQLTSLRADWDDLNYVQRGDRLIQLLTAGCSERGLAHDLGVDDGTVRRAIEIARLPELDRKAIEAGASPDAFLRAARARTLRKDANARYESELKDGTPSDVLRNKLAWFLMTEQPMFCSWCGYVERLIGELQSDLLERARGGTVMHQVEVKEYLDPAYPLVSAIKMAKPETEDNVSEMGTAVKWLLKLILLLEPLKNVRDAAVEKLRDTLFRVHLQSGEIRAFAKANTPASLVAILSEQPLQKPLYH
jgi:hypothetical protein